MSLNTLWPLVTIFGWMAEYAQRQPLENNLALIKRVLWDSPVSNPTGRANERNPQYRFEDYSFKIDSINIDLLFAYFKNLYSEISDCTMISCGSPIWYCTSDYPDNNLKHYSTGLLFLYCKWRGRDIFHWYNFSVSLNWLTVWFVT